MQAQNVLRDFSLISILFERLNNEGRRFARQAIHDLLDRSWPSNTYVAVFRLDRTVKVIQDFTNDPRLVERAVMRATEGMYSDYVQADAVLQRLDTEGLRYEASTADKGEPRDPTEKGAVIMERKLRELMKQLLEDELYRLRFDQNRRQIGGLNSLIKALGTLSGRKSVLYMSEGLMVPRDYDPWLDHVFRDVIGLANRNNVTFYALDLRGLQAVPILGPRGSMRYGDLMSTQMDLDKLAVDTGGFLIANTNDFRQPLRRAVDELQIHYELTYTPSSYADDGRFRKIEVKPLRRGLRVQARTYAN